MVSMSVGGSGSKQSKPSRRATNAVQKCIQSVPSRAAIAILAIAVIVASRRSSIFDSSSLASGRIPAARRHPHEHWSYIANDVSFVQTMAAALVGKTNAVAKKGKRQKVRSDRPNENAVEASDLRFRRETRMTRCSSTMSAITTYFCGASIAQKLDSARGHDSEIFTHFGTRSFRQYLKCRHRQGLRDGSHRRSAYRIGIAANTNFAGYSHAFSIVAQPNGTYYWLQSFIWHYSLSTWMKKVDHTHMSGHAGHLTYDELMDKLDRVDRLMTIDDWTPQANADYYDLFRVDRYPKTAGESKVKKWTLDHRLDTFAWDEACEYPLPDGVDQTKGNRTADDASYIMSRSDNCTVALALSRFL